MSIAVMTGEVVDPLTDDEYAEREQLETIIARGFGSFVEVGEALMAVRDRCLYRDRHSTFVGYLERVWQVSESRAYQLMAAATVTVEISTVVEEAEDDDPIRATPIPQNEAQARELTRFIGQPVVAAAVLREAEKDGAPTAKKIKAAAKTVAPSAAPVKPKAPAEPDSESDVRRKRAAAHAHGLAEQIRECPVIDEKTIRLLEAICTRWRSDLYPLEEPVRALRTHPPRLSLWQRLRAWMNTAHMDGEE